MSKKIETYSQCHFAQEREDGARVVTTGYIDAREARVGARMTLKGVEGIWTVTAAGVPGQAPVRTGREGSMD